MKIQEGIKYNFSNQLDTQILEILNNQIGEVELDWNELNFSKIRIVVGENSNISFLELDEKKDLKVTYECKANSFVRINVFNKNEAGLIDREFNIKENAQVEVAYADFSNGSKTLKVLANLDERNAHLIWHLATLSKEKDIKNFKINFNHNCGETIALMDNYGVCKDSATLNFLGDAIILKGAKKANTKQNAKIMLFDKTCHAKASPKLCIYENDVEASHGASEGQINSEHVFYLMSRGLSEKDAKRLITLGYLYPIIQYFGNEKVKKEIEKYIVERV